MLDKIKNIIDKIEKLFYKNKVTGKFMDFLKVFLHKAKGLDVAFASSFLAYSLILSFIPMFIFISQMLSYLNASFDDMIMNAIAYLPDSSEAILVPLIEGLISVRSSGLSILALVSWLWLGSRGFLGLVQTLNKVFDVKNKPNAILSKVLGVVYMLGFIAIFAGLLLFNVFNKKILAFIDQYTELRSYSPEIYDVLVNGFLSLFPILMMIVMLGIFFKFAPSTSKEERIPWSSAFIGATVSSVATILITLLYSYSQNNSSMNLYYGSMAGILALLVWLLMICQAIVTGGQIAAAHWVYKTEKGKEISEKALKDIVLEDA